MACDICIISRERDLGRVIDNLEGKWNFTTLLKKTSLFPIHFFSYKDLFGWAKVLWSFQNPVPKILTE